MSGKRRAARLSSDEEAHPGVDPKVQERQATASRWRRVGKWLLILGLIGTLRRRRQLRLPLPDDRRPEAQRGLRDPDLLRLLRGRQGAARPVRHPEPRVDPARRDARHDQGRRRGRGEPRPSGPTAASTRRASSGPPSTTRRAARTQGASTITQQYVKILYLTQEQSLTRKIKEAFISLKLQRDAQQGGGPRGLPQHHLLRAGRLRHPGRLQGLLRRRGQGPEPQAVRGARQRGERPQRPRPRPGEAGQA